MAYDTDTTPPGKTGFILSLVPWVAYLLSSVLAVGGSPGFGWGSSTGSLVGILPIVVPPISLVFSIVGLFKDERKGFAIAGVVISGLAFVILLLPTVCDWQVMW